MERAACDEALAKADAVIKSQDELILKLSESNESKRSENDRLSKALVELKHISDSQFDKSLTYGAGGVLIGIITILLLKH